MKEYKYWMYYKIDSYDDTYDLYAYTDDKVLADMFESQRNMKKFKRVVKKLDNKGVHDLAEDYQGMILQVFPIKFYDYDTKDVIPVKYALTTMEKLDFIYYSSNTSLTVYKNAWTNPLIFNKEIRNALFELNYHKYYLYIAESLSDKAKSNLKNKIVDNIVQICEDGGFYPQHQRSEYFDKYTEMIHSRIPGMDDEIKVDELSILVKCIKDTL